MNEVSRQAWYKEWFSSPFYHKLYAERNEEEAKTFIHKLIGHLQPAHASRILDVGCGRGQNCKTLAALGFDVTGIDAVADNIDRALPLASDKLRFYLHDIRLPFWINYFDCAFNLFTNFGYFKTWREHTDAIRTIGGSLKPGGYFVIDYLNVHYAEEHILHNENKLIGNTSYDIHRWHDDTDFYKKISITDPTLQQPLTITEKLSKFSLGDFTEMLSYHSLQVQNIYGDYNLNPYDVRKTPRLIIIARKKSLDTEDKEKRLYSDGRTTDPLT
jgi:SAM-dependent methyltransferase